MSGGPAFYALPSDGVFYLAGVVIAGGVEAKRIRFIDVGHPAHRRLALQGIHLDLRWSHTHGISLRPHAEWRRAGRPRRLDRPHALRRLSWLRPRHEEGRSPS